MDLLVGHAVKGRHGSYKLIEVLKAGSLSTVWKGWDQTLQRFVAVKVFHAFSPGSSERVKKKLVLEGLTTSLLDRPSGYWSRGVC
jgi:hypothetical protein